MCVRRTPVPRAWSAWRTSKRTTTAVCVQRARRANAPVRAPAYIFTSGVNCSLSELPPSPPPPSDGHSLTFSGSSYVKYHLIENENKELLKLSLRLRTFSSHATVMYAKGTDYSILEVGKTNAPPSQRRVRRGRSHLSEPSTAAGSKGQRAGMWRRLEEQLF